MPNNWSLQASKQADKTQTCPLPPFSDSEIPVLREWCNFKLPMLKRQTTMFIWLEQMISGQSSWPIGNVNFWRVCWNLFWYCCSTDLCSVESGWNHSGNLQFQPCSKIFKTFPRVVSCCCISYVPQILCGNCAVPSQIDNCGSLKSKPHLAQYCHLDCLLEWLSIEVEGWTIAKYCCSIACSLELC